MPSGLHLGRFDAVMTCLRHHQAASVLDLGCGAGDFLLPLCAEEWVERVVGVEPAASPLGLLRTRVAKLPEHQRAKAQVLQGSVLAPAEWLAAVGTVDAAVMIEVIEHLDPSQLSQLETTLFRAVAPRLVLLTTPNADFNALLGVPPHRFRHPDHRFEWGRVRFAVWAAGVASRSGHLVTMSDLAGQHPHAGGASQMAVFVRPK